MSGHTLTQEELFCLQGCRTYKQYCGMRKTFETGSCTFCELDRVSHDVLWEDENVYAWMCPEAYMREELKMHIIIAPKRHVRFTTDLSDDEILSIHHAKQSIREEYGYQGGLDHVREGDMSLNAGTVPHLHYNIFEPNCSGEARIPLFKDPSDRGKNVERASVFARWYEDGNIP